MSDAHTTADSPHRAVLFRQFAECATLPDLQEGFDQLAAAADYRRLAAHWAWELAAQAMLPGSQTGHALLAFCYEAVAAQLERSAENAAA